VDEKFDDPTASQPPKKKAKPEPPPKKSAKKRGRKKKPPVVQVYLPPSQEQVKYYQKTRQKPPKPRQQNKESVETTMHRNVYAALDEFKSVPFEMDPMLLVAPPPLIASRIEYPEHTQRLFRHFRVSLDHTARKNMYVAIPYVSYLICTYL